MMCIVRVVEKGMRLEMLARLRAGQCDGHHCHADDDFGGWIETTVLFLAVSNY